VIAALAAMAGLAAGLAHGLLLGRSAGRPPAAFGLVARALLVGVVLLLAARAGQLVPATAGWFVAFALTVGVLRARLS